MSSKSEPAAERVEIRAATPQDKEAVSALLKISYSELLAASYPEEVLEPALPYMVNANAGLLASGTYYVAETAAGGIVGCGGWSVGKPGTGESVAGEGHVRHFAVHPEWTRRGIASSLMARCIGDARAAGIRKLHCFATWNAEGFYRAEGFERVGPIEVAMGPTVRFPAVLMQRVIA